MRAAGLGTPTRQAAWAAVRAVPMAVRAGAVQAFTMTFLAEWGDKSQARHANRDRFVAPLWAIDAPGFIHAILLTPVFRLIVPANETIPRIVIARTPIVVPS